MKIRTDFVTNSSSSSFSLIINVGLKNGNVITTGEIFGNGMDTEEITALGSPLYLAHAKDISELTKLIKESYFVGEGLKWLWYDGEKFYDDSYPHEIEVYPLFYNEHSFIEEIEKVKSISDINFIEVIGDTSFGEVIEKYRINMDDFIYIYEKEGDFQESEGGSGTISFDDDYNETKRSACCKWCGDVVQREKAYIGKWSFGLYCSKECYEEGLKKNKKDISEVLTIYEDYYKDDQEF